MAYLTGCFAGHARYPSEWSPPQAAATSSGPAAATQCPNIEGRYDDHGTLAPDTPEELCGSAHYTKFRTIGDWFCETSLTLNLFGVHAPGTWVELLQPDPDTLVATFDGSAADSVTLQRSKGDFDCAAEGLTRTLHASTFSLGGDEGQENRQTKAYNAFATISNLFIASGGVQTLDRSFTRVPDGPLIMSVRRHSKGMIVGLPYSNDFSTYVRWPQATPSSEESPDTLAASK
jgi:hypothetical protein